MSVTLPVLWALPWVMRLSMLDSVMPRPTWRGLVPPMVAVGAPAPDRFCVSASLNVVRWLL